MDIYVHDQGINKGASIEKKHMSLLSIRREANN